MLGSRFLTMLLPSIWSGSFPHLRNSFIGNCSYKFRLQSGFTREKVFDGQTRNLHNKRYQFELVAKIEEKNQKPHSKKQSNINLSLHCGSVKSYSSKCIVKTQLHEYKAVQHFNLQHIPFIPERNIYDWPATVIVFDTETTGFSYKEHRIIEIAFRDLYGGRNSTFQSLVNPGEAVRNAFVHGIQSDMVNRPDVPRFDELVTIMIQFIRTRQMDGKPVVLVAHNGWRFDFPFFIMECQRCSVEIPEDWVFVDTLPLARKLLKPGGAKGVSLSLEALCKHYRIPLVGPAHRAMPDVTALSYVLRELTHDLELPIPALLAGGCRASDIIKVLPNLSGERD